MQWFNDLSPEISSAEYFRTRIFATTATSTADSSPDLYIANICTKAANDAISCNLFSVPSALFRVAYLMRKEKSDNQLVTAIVADFAKSIKISTVSAADKADADKVVYFFAKYLTVQYRAVASPAAKPCSSKPMN
jgi:hypothetical protein